MATVAEKLVARWHGMHEQEFPFAVLERTALCFEDTIGVALASLDAGVGLPGVKLAADAGPGAVTVWGSGGKAPLADAVFANGMLAHAMDYDDLHGPAVMHSSSPIVPTAIGLGQQLNASPREILVAAAVGYEFAARLGRLAPGAFQANGFQSTGLLGTFATTAIASRMLSLTSSEATNALGIAGSLASGSMEFLANGSDVKQMHPGVSAQAGIRAALLAKAGMTGPATVFEGRFGVFKSFARTEVDAGTVDANIGDPWEVSLMGPKPYPACLCVHPQVQAILALRERGELGADRVADIEEIVCEVPELYVQLVYEPREAKIAVRTAYEARFSAAYCIARVWLDGFLDASSFGEAQRADPRAQAIASKVSYRIRDLPEYPASFPARVRVVFRNGQACEAYVPHNLGSPLNPMSDAQLRAKFLGCATPVLGSAGANALQAALRALPRANDAQSFFAALSAAPLKETTWK
jgi:2-methylcitrate dehydratase PrpD